MTHILLLPRLGRGLTVFVAGTRRGLADSQWWAAAG
jgi:hypothetical protein